MSESEQPRPGSYYYSDPLKLDTDMAENIVREYLEDDTPRDVTRVKHVLNDAGYPYTEHNMHRVLRALKRYCEPYNADRSGPTRFKIPEKYR